MYFVNKHLSSWALLGLKENEDIFFTSIRPFSPFISSRQKALLSLHGCLMLSKKGEYTGSCSLLFNSLPNDKIFGFVQIEGICRQQNKCDLKIGNYLGKGRKPCVQRRKCWLPAFSPFPTMFSKGYFVRVVKSWDCVLKG